MKRASLPVAGLSLVVVLSLAQPAAAQLHLDASAQVGVMKRFLSDTPPGGPDAGFGPAAQLSAHVALFPLVRVGAYVGHDISPMGGSLSARDLTWGGIRAKIMSPWPRGATRAYLFGGFGYDGMYARSSRVNGQLREGAGGGFFEVPFGVGVTYTFWKPFALVAELGGKVGFGEHGSAYDLPARGGPGSAPLPAGSDRFAVGLTVGILLDL